MLRGFGQYRDYYKDSLPIEDEYIWLRKRNCKLREASKEKIKCAILGGAVRDLRLTPEQERRFNIVRNPADWDEIKVEFLYSAYDVGAVSVEQFGEDTGEEEDYPMMLAIGTVQRMIVWTDFNRKKVLREQLPEEV